MPPDHPHTSAAPPDQAVLDREAERMVSAFVVAGVEAILIGGAAVRSVCDLARQPPLTRVVGDLDFVVAPGQQEHLQTVMEGLGYVEDRETNRIQGDRRLIYYGGSTGLKVDFFVGAFEMCHTVRVTAGPSGIADVTSLVLTKLQIVELTEKDVSDLLALFGDHALGEGHDAIEAPRIVELTRTDWGLCTTVTDSLRTLADVARERPGGAPTVERIEVLRAQIDGAGKSRSWKLRDRIGRRKRWYNVPEEIADE